MDWFEETLHPGFRSRLGIDRIIHETKTEHQHLIIFDNPEFGRVLAQRPWLWVLLPLPS